MLKVVQDNSFEGLTLAQRVRVSFWRAPATVHTARLHTATSVYVGYDEQSKVPGGG